MKLVSQLSLLFARPLFALTIVKRKLLKQRLPVRFYQRVLLPRLVRRKQVAVRTRPLKVCFYAMNLDMWRYGDVYRRFAQDPRFAPCVVTAPAFYQPESDRVAVQERMVKAFEAQGMRVVRGYDAEHHRALSIASLHPDLIFYTQPYDKCIDASLEFHHAWGALHCYAPYSFQLSRVEWGWNNNLQNYCWKQFFVNEAHLRIAQEVALAQGRNMVAAGYCVEEEQVAARADHAACEAAWRNDPRKRVIWAPHHSIGEKDLFRVSSFLEICDLMVELREAYRDKIIFAFKPHPVLKARLYERWGWEKTDAYYAGWAAADNAFDAQGNYRYLFAGSDAMIHCSASFILEYLYADKPVQYVYSKTRQTSSDWGEVGAAALSVHVPAHEPDDIRRFLDETVLGGRDELKAAREAFVRTSLKSPNGRMFSQNVYEEVLKGLGLSCPTR